MHEVVLCDDDGKLFEGLSSNFFVLVRDESGAPVLYTAREGVLLGTVRCVLPIPLCGLYLVCAAPAPCTVTLVRARRHLCS